MKQNSTSKQKLFFVLTLFVFFFGGIVKIHAQSQSNIALTWNIGMNCQIYSEDDRKKIFLEEIEESICINVCRYSVIEYTLDDLPEFSTTSWNVSGGVKINETDDQVIINWTVIGTGNISFTITTPTGLVITKELCIKVLEGPEAAFSSTPAAINEPIFGCTNQTINFSNESQPNGTDAIVSYYWQFGDGDTESAQSPIHLYENPGTYEVTLTVTNSCGCTSSMTTEVEIKESEGFDISCPSVVCDKQTSTYFLPQEVIDYCGDFIWNTVGGTIVGNSNDSSVAILWDNVDENGFGYLTFNPEQCDLPCLIPTTIRVPVIASEGVIQGPTSLCLGKQGRYSMPQWPTTDFKWYVTSGNATIIQTDQRNEVILTPTQAGPITILVKYNNTLIHCGGMANLVIEVNSPEPFTGASVVCLGSSSTYTTQSTNPVNWTLRSSNGTTVATQNNSDTFTHPFSVVGNFTLTVSGPGICDGQTKNIIVTPALVAPVLNNPTTEVCPNAPYSYAVVNPNPNSTYLWEIVNGSILGSATGPEVNVTFLGSGQIKVKRQQISPAGCDSPFTVQSVNAVTINADISDAVTNNVVGQMTACTNNYFTYKLIDVAGGLYSDDESTYTWSISPNTAGSISSGQGTKTVEILWNNNASLQLCTLNVEVKKCTVVENVNRTVIVTDIPVINITNPSSVCSGADITFTVGSTPSGALGPNTTIHWDFGNGNFANTPAGQLYITKDFNNGTLANIGYTVVATVTNSNSCPGSLTTSSTFIVTPGPNASISNYTGVNSFCTAIDVDVDLVASTTGGASIQWFKFGSSVVQGTGGTFHVGATLNFGSYYFIATLNGCKTKSNSILIFQKCSEPLLCTIEPDPTTGITWTNNCSQLVLTGTASGNPISKLWTVVGPGVNINNVASNTGTNQYTLNVLEAGYYTVVYTTTYIGTNGQPCKRTESEIVPVHYVPNFKVSATCGPVVNNATTYNVTLTDDSNFLTSISNKKWQYESGPTPTGPWTMESLLSSTATITINNVSAGTSYIKQTIVGDFGGVTQPVCVKILPLLNLIDLESLTIAFLPPDCYDTSVDFSVPNTFPNNGDTYLWSFETVNMEVVTNTNPSPTRVFNSDLAVNPVIVKVLFKNKYGCEKELQAPVTIPAKCFNGDISSLTPDATACKGSPVVLTYEAGSLPDTCIPTTYTWMNGSTVAGTTTENTFEAYFPGFYTVIVSDGICEYTSPSVITPLFINLPTLALYGSTTVCLGEEAGFSVNSDATIIKWTIDSVYTASLDNEDSISLNLGLGIHSISVTVISADGCEKTAEQTIEVFPAPIQVTVSDPFLVDCQTYTLELSAYSPETGSYIWNNGAIGVSNPDGSNTITVTAGGPYMVTFTNVGGCSTTAQIMVPKDPKAYMWVFPTGCYQKCKDEETFLLGPTLPVKAWNWLLDDVSDLSGNYTVPSNYPLTETGTYNLTLNTGICDFSSPSMSLSASNCEGCELDATVQDVVFEDEVYCSSLVTIDVESFYGVDLQASLVSNNNNLIVNPGSITLVPGSNTITFTVIPINGFNGGNVSLSLIGTIVVDGEIKTCSTPIEFELKECKPEQARPAGVSENEPSLVNIKGDIMLYPNPAQDKVNIRFDSAQSNSQVEVYDLTGRLMASYATSSRTGVWELDLAPMATGVYVVLLRQGSAIIMQRKLQVL